MPMRITFSNRSLMRCRHIVTHPVSVSALAICHASRLNNYLTKEKEGVEHGDPPESLEGHLIKGNGLHGYWLTRALIADFERRARGIDPFNEHSFSRSNQSKLFLVLKWAHRRQCAKMMMQG